MMTTIEVIQDAWNNSPHKEKVESLFPGSHVIMFKPGDAVCQALLNHSMEKLKQIPPEAFAQPMAPPRYRILFR